jgi:DNA-binding protein YbaB
MLSQAVAALKRLVEEIEESLSKPGEAREGGAGAVQVQVTGTSTVR